MKRALIEDVIQSTSRSFPLQKIDELKAEIKSSTPPSFVDPARMNLRRARLTEADIQPSTTSLERILGINDLVDVSYLVKGINSSKSICRIILRDKSDREIGYGTGFKVSPHLILTNFHVLKDQNDARLALAEFNYELDLQGNPKPVTRFLLEPGKYFFNNLELDFALVYISERPIYGNGNIDDFGFLRMYRVEGKINKGEAVSIIQHPSGQPKQIAIRENDLLSIESDVILYQSDTAQGSSGSPVFNDSWQLVGLHHSGVPKTNAQGQWLLKNGNIAGPDAEDGDIDWRANEGIRATRILNHIENNSPNSTYVEEFLKVASGEIIAPDSIIPQEIKPFSLQQPFIITPPLVQPLNYPFTITISMGNVQAPTSVSPTPLTGKSISDASEKMRIPDIDSDYNNRIGYKSDFLDIEVPLPIINKKGEIAKMDNGNIYLPYEHFSIVVNKIRRLALLCASNISASPSKKKPEPNKDYSRKGLGGFDRNDTEKWLTDPRIPQNQQLPDIFYTKDGGAFDKGHIVRREDICWGDSYKEVKRANGDTYHVTNCSPQVADFNRSNLRGVWGSLENYILKQAKTEKYCLFAGTVFRENDRVFSGKDQVGPIKIQIPSAYWKIVIAQAKDSLQAFAFILEQNLKNVPVEFAVNAEWIDYMISIKGLQSILKFIEFPKSIIDADQFKKPAGESLRRSADFGNNILEYMNVK